MKAKWRVEHRDTWQDGHGNDVETFAVINDNNPDQWGRPQVAALVWWDGKQARCERCPGVLSAMLTTCSHARVVKRVRTKEAAYANP